MKEVLLLLWLGYVTVLTVGYWFTSVNSFVDFLTSILVWMFIFIISASALE